MADVIITLKVMPVSPEVDMTALEEKVKDKVKSFTGIDNIKSEIAPVAFGLKALNVTFVADEAKGSTDPLEEDIKSLDPVNDCEVTDVRRAVG